MAGGVKIRGFWGQNPEIRAKNGFQENNPENRKKAGKPQKILNSGKPDWKGFCEQNLADDHP